MTHAELTAAAKRQADFLREEWAGQATVAPMVAELLAVLDTIPLLIDGLTASASFNLALAERCEAQSQLLSKRAEK